MHDPENTDQFHPGERLIQERLGVRDQMIRTGKRAIRPYLVDQHRAFFEQITEVFYGALDEQERPWASMLLGDFGFIQSPDNTRLDLTPNVLPGDPVFSTLNADDPMALLGLMFQTRRRNRANGNVVEKSKERLSIQVTQSFGNCPKYIQSRDLVTQTGVSEAPQIQINDTLTESAKAHVSRSDTFFVATAYTHDIENESAIGKGVDVSHRGGRKGFVRVENERDIVWPDFAGNRFFNTLGNLVVNPKAGVTFIDFDSGHVLFLTGVAEIDWSDETQSGFTGSERLVRFTTHQAIEVNNAFARRWSAPNFSPFLEGTDIWPENHGPEDGALA